MSEVLLRRTFPVRGGDFENAGETSAGVTAILKDLEIEPDIILRAGVVTFEAEMNVVMYADEGTVTFILKEDEIVLEVADQGPGIPDVDLAMQPGYSTASDEMRDRGFGYGLGLPNIKKNSDAFLLETRVGKGTRVCSSIRLNANG